MQATVLDFEDDELRGHVVLDDGHSMAFGPDAFRGSGIRFLRAGQRVRLELDDAGEISFITIATLP